MNKSFVIPAVFASVILSFLFSNANAEEFDVFYMPQYISVSESKLSSGTIEFSRVGGEFKDVSAKGDVLALMPGDMLSCRFKLPDNTINVKATIDYYVSSDSAVGKIRLNKKLFFDDNSLLKKRTQQGLSTTTILLKNVQVQNELRVFSIEGEVCIHQIKIDYNYRMPSCKTDDVTVVLKSPVANTDVLQQNMRFEWKVKGARKNGWITLKYQKQDGAWETVPGAELLDCQATKKNGNCGEFFWNNHGLSAIPKIQIEYHDYNAELPKRFSREMRPYVLKNTESVDAFILLVKRFLEEDKELLKNIVLKRDKITVFTPTKRTWEEWSQRQGAVAIYLLPIESDVKPVMSSLSEYHLSRLIQERKNLDYRVNFELLDLTSIEKNMNIFDIITKSVNDLQQSVHKRGQEKPQDQETLDTIKTDISKFQFKVKNDKMKYLSFSVVSPYIAAADRDLQWNEKSNYLDELSTFYKNDWIQECSGDVQKQFSVLQNKYPFIKPFFKGASRSNLQQ